MSFDTESKILRSVYPVVPIPRELTYTKLMVNALLKHGDSVCQIGAVSGRKQTYREVLETSYRLACSLQKMGLQTGALVGVRCGIILEYLVTAIAIIRAGCTVLSLKGQTTREFKYQLQDAKPVLVFAEPQYCARILEASQGIENFKGVASFGESPGCSLYADLVAGTDGRLREVTLDPKEAVMVITYSGGTTGPPKGVMLTHHNFVATQIMWDAWTMMLPVPNSRTAKPITLDWMSPVHLSGIVTVLGNCLRGCTTVLLSSDKPRDILAAVEKYGITHMPLMPTRLMMLHNSDLVGQFNTSTWTSAGVGGGVVPSAVIEAFKRKFQLETVYFGYSMTELTGFLTMPTTNPESIGAPFPMTEIKIINVATKESLGPNEDGEICARGPQVMKGYLNRKEATEQTIDAEGWLHTGDIGHFDDDGNVTVVERIKDLIRCIDVHVVPAELEEVLLSHPSVAEAVVVGVPHLEFGEAPKAFVIPAVTISPEVEDSLTQELLLYVSEQVEYPKQLHGGLEFVSQLPKSSAGQYLRRELKAEQIRKHPIP
ncbi:uncharacterized protein LOC135377727 [Ornithodoros turicata]|uniref:uncharacterized protein LOC135377727 n=1 Tax=Ornithodoros turicata TaxID=34597 RepID=UPI003139880D